MRVTKQVHAAHRAAILEQAGRLFRRAGVAGVGVAEVTRAAGLTHGGFYGHFASKEALAAEACRSNLVGGAEAWRRRAAIGGLSAIVHGYLTEAHRDQPEGGCMLPALGPELARAGAPVAEALAEGTRALLDAIAEAAPEADAMAVLSAMVGGMVLARALAADPEASRAALAGAAHAALAAAR